MVNMVLESSTSRFRLHPLGRMAGWQGRKEASDGEGICRLLLFSCFSRGQLFVTSWTVTFQAPLSMGFSRQEH